MEQSPLGSTPSESEKLKRPEGLHEDDDPVKSADRRMVADQLLAALASGNLDHLAQAREKFLHQPATKLTSQPSPRPPAPAHDSITQSNPELTASLERRSTARPSAQTPARP